MADYPRYLIKAIIGYNEPLQSLKYKVTSALTPDVLVIGGEPSYYEQEGNTLKQKSSQSTRIPKNSNARIENLAVLMADVELAMHRALTMEELIAVSLYCTRWSYDDNSERELPEQTQIMAYDALDKLVDYLNP